MKTYPQLKTGREYRKIGLALIKKYPCLAEKGNHLKPEVTKLFFLSRHLSPMISPRLYFVENYQSKCAICVKKSVQNLVE